METRLKQFIQLSDFERSFSPVSENGDVSVQSLTIEPLPSTHPGEHRKVHEY